MKSASDIEIFVALCQRSNFRSRDEILEGIRLQKYELTRYSSEIGVPAASMLDVYRRRSKHIAQFAQKSSHAKRMLGDIDAYVTELENARDDEIKLWRLSVDGMWNWSLFEGTVAGKILGCIYGADRRSFSSDEWDRLWGREAE